MMENGGGEPKKKRKRNSRDTLGEAYSSIKSITARESTGRPGSPHRFFRASFDVKFANSNKGEGGAAANQVEDGQTGTLEPSSSEHMASEIVVNQHGNGLCVVTVGTTLRETVDKIEFLVTAAPDTSANERRKRQHKMLQGKKITDVVTPSTVLARLTLENGDKELIRAGVWGTILELNKEVTPTLLKNDPLLDGYLAVILPSGSYPPPSLLISNADKSLAETCDEQPNRDDL